MALPKKYRLNSEADYKKAVNQGKTIRTNLLFTWFLKNKLGYPRVALRVGVKISKKAAVRNQIRRLIAGAIKELDFKSYPYDLVIVSSPPIVDKSFQEIKAEIEKTIIKIISQ